MCFRLLYPAMPNTNRYPQYGSPLPKGSCQRLRGFFALHESVKTYARYRPAYTPPQGFSAR